MKRISQTVAAVLLLLAIGHPLSTVLAQGTAFTYQGQLNLNSGPAQGNYDFQFILFTTNQSGLPASAILTNAGVPVTNGLFITTMDFGGGVFTGTNYWLDISVRTNGNGVFSDLSPRQPITPTPYAITAANLSSVIANNTFGISNCTVAGGFQNEAFGQNSTISGGYQNIISPASINGTIAGGQSNSVISPNSTIGGGEYNSEGLDTYFATIAGGGYHTIGTNSSSTTISGGYSNSISNNTVDSVIGGGSFNHIGMNSPYSTIAGGRVGTIADNATAATIGGGYFNSSAGFATVGGGEGNNSSGVNSTVGGGFGNLSTGYASTVGGGYYNSSSNNYAIVSGGNQGVAGGYEATVAGGERNLALGGASVIGGGYHNVCLGNSATIAGGNVNTNSGDNATVGGGLANSSVVEGAMIGGGEWNSNGAFCGSIPGGYLNIAAGAYSFAAGQQAQANQIGTFVWSDDSSASPFSSTVANQFSVRAAGGVRFVTSGAGMTLDGLAVLTSSALNNLNAANLTSGTLPDARLSGNVALLNASLNTFAGDLSMAGGAAYHHLQLSGGNSLGYLYGSYPAFNDGIHMGYNYYADANGFPHVPDIGGGTSRITAGFSEIILAIGGVKAAHRRPSDWTRPPLA